MTDGVLQTKESNTAKTLAGLYGCDPSYDDNVYKVLRTMLS